MFEPGAFFDALTGRGFSFFTGVPDSLLKEFCAYVTDHVDTARHIIAANEGSAVALAAGHYLATGNPGVVYMQNSGQGNAINPLTSLADGDVFGIPMLLLVGWRGEPGREDEPQHVKQGKITCALFETLGIEHRVLPEELPAALACLEYAAERTRATSTPFALVVREGTFAPYKLRNVVRTSYPLDREGAVKLVADAVADAAVIVATTGKTSRELFEHREGNGQSHSRDFRTVGCMGHASQIAMGIALEKPGQPVVCLDGDGAVIMHMGAMAIVGTQGPSNFKHVVINNGAHDSVGGQPTVAFTIDLCQVARGCGYRWVESASTPEEIERRLRDLLAASGPALLEIRVNKGARANLGRPTISPSGNKQELMTYLRT